MKEKKGKKGKRERKNDIHRGEVRIPRAGLSRGVVCAVMRLPLQNDCWIQRRYIMTFAISRTSCTRLYMCT